MFLVLQEEGRGEENKKAVDTQLNSTQLNSLLNSAYLLRRIAPKLVLRQKQGRCW
jgi:hypothetical protein